MTQQKQLHLYKLRIGVSHVMIYKSVWQQSGICLKFVF